MPDRRTRWTPLGRLRRASDVASIAGLVSAFAAASGHPAAEYAMLAVGAAGVLLALLQYGRGYRRAMWLFLGCCALGFLGGRTVWPLVL